MAAKKKKDDGKQNDDERRNAGALFIPAGIFIGMGYGFFLGNIAGGLFVGMGFGFVAFAITNIIMGFACRK
ncbi:hypothetical protein JXB28_01555 [Candidatus Woesearchaeota archaeon]|nr:hypothetical protein [Candidatus Woesearchaeota archaeon]